MDEYLKINSKKIAIQWHKLNSDNAVTLIFLHEGLGSIAQWRDFPKKLAKATDCNSFVYSRYGYGNSDPCDLPRKVNFMHIEAIKILPQIIKAAGIKKFILVGHSDGGSIAIIYAGFYQDFNLKGIITQAAHVFCEKICIDSILKAKFEYENNDLKEKLFKYHGANTEFAFRGWNDVWLNPAFKYFNIEKYLSKIDVPFLAIQGEDDQYGTVDQIRSIKKNYSAVSSSLLKNCKHSPFIEQKDKTFNLMTKFIKTALK